MRIDKNCVCEIELQNYGGFTNNLKYMWSEDNRYLDQYSNSMSTGCQIYMQGY